MFLAGRVPDQLCVLCVCSGLGHGVQMCACAASLARPCKTVQTTCFEARAGDHLRYATLKVLSLRATGENTQSHSTQSHITCHNWQGTHEAQGTGSGHHNREHRVVRIDAFDQQRRRVRLVLWCVIPPTVRVSLRNCEAPTWAASGVPERLEPSTGSLVIDK